MSVFKNTISISIMLFLSLACKSQNYFYYSFSNSSAWLNGTDFCEGTERNMYMVADRYSGSPTTNGAFGAVDSNGFLQFFHEYHTQYPYNKGLGLKSLTLTSDSCLLLAGNYYTSVSPNIYYPLLIKTTSTGNLLWSKYFNNASDISSIRKTGVNENVMLLNSYSSSVLRFFKIDNSGSGINSALISVIPNTTDIEGKINLVTNDKGFIISGSLVNSIHSAYVMHTDSVYNVQWAISFPQKEVGSVVKAMDGGILVALNEYSSQPSNSITVVKLNAAGIPLWSTSFISSSRKFYEGSLVENSDSTIFFIPLWLKVNPTLFNYAVSLIKMSNSGSVISSMDSLRIQRVHGILKASDGRYCTFMNTGTANSFRSAFLMTDTLFNNIPCINYLTSPVSYTVDYTMPTSYPLSTNTSFFTSGSIAYTSVSITDTLLIPMTSQPCYPPTSVNQISEQNIISISPNPVSTTLSVLTQPYHKSTLYIYSIWGQELFTGNIKESASSSKILIDVSHFPKGLYIVTLITENGRVTKKFIKN